MKITLTGATGFVGGHLMKYLGGLGYEVDTISTKEFMKEDWRRLDDFGLEPAKLKFETAFTVEHTKPDIVIHCAWLRERDLHAQKHLEFAELSCNFLQACKDRGIPVINLGSSSEYGVKDEPMKEDMICEPINTYGIAKLMVTLYAKKLGFNTLRLFTVTGKGGKSFMDIYKTAKKYSNPHDVRDYINVHFVNVAVQRLIHAQHIYGEIINVGSGDETKNNNVLEYGGLYSDENIDEWHKYPQTQYELRHWSANTDKMKQLLNI